MQPQRKRMTPGEWAERYTRQKRALTNTASPAEALLLEVCDSLIERNLKLAGNGKWGRSR